MAIKYSAKTNAKIIDVTTNGEVPLSHPLIPMKNTTNQIISGTIYHSMNDNCKRRNSLFYRPSIYDSL